ncbi:hypothetical protein ACI68E_003001 [Malassezia pachydermatis]
MNWIANATRDMSPTKKRETLFPLSFQNSIWQTPTEPLSDAEPSSDSDSDDASAHHSSASTAWTVADNSIDGVPLSLPQRPCTAMTRKEKWSCSRNDATIRVCNTSTPPRPVPITNHGLALAPSPLQQASNNDQLTTSQQNRSEDRARAAQRLFYALGHSTRWDAKVQQQQQQPQIRPGITMLHGLTAQAKRRHSQDGQVDQITGTRDQMTFTPTMHGTQHCVIATERSTFEFVVTPPTPRMDEHEWTNGSKLTGIRLKSHKTSSEVIETPPSPNLVPPPFELAPGRALQVAQRKKEVMKPLPLNDMTHHVPQVRVPHAAVTSKVSPPRKGVPQPSSVALPLQPVQPMQIPHQPQTPPSTIRKTIPPSNKNGSYNILQSQLAHASPAGKAQILSQWKGAVVGQYAKPTVYGPTAHVAKMDSCQIIASHSVPSVVKYVPPGRRRLPTTQTMATRPIAVQTRGA